MMPDLGKYAGDVLAAYGITILLLAGLIWRSLARSAKMKRLLKQAEERRTHG
ncbi:MAG: heme exporter protein CcmD [Alphaproteobacteria bacterium]|nr:heme exporter protein CcmD [Alphaproteobacteria bacterium]MBU1280695.1 heme exporter protein CcmD [Alphaproteobacteria bacterium]MBU1572086.1 heme exporter protein CcmD [Alphaproteobacteria bacterium]MBU1828519.1 heme exporter protein CcmD [Alphaproteobacteria bacterium]MBU2079815.1 heme exporter protein CcmD [Alphaproteobacteria bacterium]